MSSVVLIFFSVVLSAVFCYGSVVLTVEPINGGVTVTASGSIDVSGVEFDGWESDLPLDGDQFINGRLDIVEDGSIAEIWNIPEASIAIGVQNVFFEDVDFGTAGNGINIATDSLWIAGASASDDNMAPVETVFEFDWVATDTNGSLDDYVDGFILWDSNGFGFEGGQTISFQVVPEPNSLALLLIGSLALVSSRRK